MRSREGGNRGTEEYYLCWGTVAPNSTVAESSVPQASDWVVEHHHPTTSTIWGHGDQLKIKERI